MALRSVFDAEAKHLLPQTEEILKKIENQIKKRSCKNEKICREYCKRKVAKASISDQELQIFPDKK